MYFISRYQIRYPSVPGGHCWFICAGEKLCFFFYGSQYLWKQTKFYNRTRRLKVAAVFKGAMSLWTAMLPGVQTDFLWDSLITSGLDYVVYGSAASTTQSWITFRIRFWDYAQVHLRHPQQQQDTIKPSVKVSVTAHELAGKTANEMLQNE